MSKPVMFIHVDERPGITEADLPAEGTVGGLHDVLIASGIQLDPEAFIFLDEAEQHLPAERDAKAEGLKHGCRVHVTRCRHIKTTVHYLEKTAEREFSPGARVRTVKEWAVRKFELDHKDAAEHVLQLCKSTDRPSSDTRLHQLVKGHACKLCFDLVPEKRIEG